MFKVKKVSRLSVSQAVHFWIQLDGLQADTGTLLDILLSLHWAWSKDQVTAGMIHNGVD